MKISQQARRDAKRLFRTCQVDGLLSDERARQTVGQLIARQPRNYRAVLAHFKRLVQLDLHRRTARVETVVPAPPDLITMLQASLNRRYGSGLEYVFLQNPELVGGARIQVGSDVFDGSIRARLRGLQDNF